MHRKPRRKYAVYVLICIASILLAHVLRPGEIWADATVSPKFGPDLDVRANTSSTVKSENLAKVVKFVEELAYTEWEHDPYIRPTGDIYRTPNGQLIDGMTHHRVRIYYSPTVAEWMRKCRNEDDEAKTADCDGPNRMKSLPDGSTIVKEMYKTVPPIYPDTDPVIGWAVMVKKNGASHDGWFWVIHFKEAFRSMDTMGTFSYSFCLTCHASTKSQNTFVSYQNLTGQNASSVDGRSYTTAADPLFMKDISAAEMSASGDIRSHRSSIDPDFENLYRDKVIYNGATVPQYSPTATGPVFPDSDYDHVWNQVSPLRETNSYLTSDNCIGCHDATLLVETETPNMLLRDAISDPVTGKTANRLLNLSVYGEWRSSPMGMAGRDPIFYSQLESEINTYPEMSGPIQNKCFSCHGGMGQRQYQADRAKLGKNGDPAFEKQFFDMSMVFAKEGPHAKYGALAREGISCMLCHQMNPEEVNVEPDRLPTTGRFTRPGDHGIIFGSTPPNQLPGGPIRTYPMQQALGLKPTHDKYINSPNMCGVCHVIELEVGHPEATHRFHADAPVADDGHVMMSEAHEQDTYREWLYSAYQTINPEIKVREASAMTCQDCHMARDFQGNGVPINPKVANVENANWPIPPAENLAEQAEITVPNRPGVGRHSFFGMNLFVLTFYQQFTRSVFGLEPDSNPPTGTVPVQDFAIEDGEFQAKNLAAKVKILDVGRTSEHLLVRVQVTNTAGHRLPSGVGFRRAFLEFQVKDQAGRTLWGSGMTNSQGVIVDGPGQHASALESEFTQDWKKLQPHWEVITRQDQAQIYEERYVNQYGPGDRKAYLLNTSFLGIGKVVKDNRLLPIGYQYGLLKEKFDKAEKIYEQNPSGENEHEVEKWESLLPHSQWGIKVPASYPPELVAPMPSGAVSPQDDAAYKDLSGSDIVTFKVPLEDVKDAASVTAQLNYQNIPPYYLRDRFQIGAGGEQTQRLYYLVGHTNTDKTPIDGWKIVVARTAASVSQK